MNSYLKDHRWEKELKGKTEVGVSEQVLKRFSTCMGDRLSAGKLSRYVT